jgi:hypothetical protein
LLAATAAIGGFERKWHSNRLSRSSVDLLRLDLIGPEPNIQAICSALKQVITKHNRAMLNLLREEENKTAPSIQERMNGQTNLNVKLPPSSTSLMRAQSSAPPSPGNNFPTDTGSVPKFDPASD